VRGTACEGRLLGVPAAAAPTEGSAARGASVRFRLAAWRIGRVRSATALHKVRRNKTRRNVSPRAVTGSRRPASETQEPSATRMATSQKMFLRPKVEGLRRPFRRAEAVFASKSLRRNRLTRHGAAMPGRLVEQWSKTLFDLCKPFPHKGLRTISAAGARWRRSTRRRRNSFCSKDLRQESG
jgi:hypothetical protein